MSYKKFFFPVGGGQELRERLYGAILVAKHFNVHLEILQCLPGLESQASFDIPNFVLEELKGAIENHYKAENSDFQKLLNEVANELNVPINKDNTNNQTTVFAQIKHGNRSSIVEQESKFCDLVVVATPPNAITTATFEASVLQSGKSVIMIPRIMKKFSTESIIIGWNNSPESSRAITSSLDILKQAKRVHIVSSKEYAPDISKLEKIQNYLSLHGIEATIELVKTKKSPGETIYKAAKKGNFDMIVAGAFSHKGLREIMFGAATKYLFEHTDIPVFMSH
ncbi:universal stress protein [Malaciobacter molluscorum LMG 25693]|uniref:Universal stress protein n=1 Tax=Malaciobacter molluscorum LMG 25693 TaxID=870501 RepID=A0A2G1DFT4_9BACT|nr:universal stress protein [Malaciobacter molluscorum]AXX93645.1 putative universal stress protein UspA [Malaciobacter molluscorum LMG 25693]PHO17349.1 universal stress protein [Malaciobacter molluscorum LMG 25693]